MSAALPLPLQQALRAVIPPQTTEQYIDQLEREVARLRKLYSDLRSEEVSLLRLPFKVDVQTKPAVRSWGSMGCEAEYASMVIDADLVRDAADTILDCHMQEWEQLAVELQTMRNGERS